jgi:hypothetical protein
VLEGGEADPERALPRSERYLGLLGPVIRAEAGTLPACTRTAPSTARPATAPLHRRNRRRRQGRRRGSAPSLGRLLVGGQG